MYLKNLIVLLFLFLFPVISNAATYYVDGAAANDSGTGQIGSPKKYIESGVALLSSSGGDTLIIADGTYSSSSDQITGIPNGQAGAYNIVKSANDGGAIVTASSGFYVASSYTQIEGLKVAYAGNKEVSGNHIKVKRCSFSGGASNGNNINLAFGGSYNLLEDSWIYGEGGRYGCLVYNSDHIIIRRVVGRGDGGWIEDPDASNPQAVFVLYNSSYVYFQNCIAIDTDLVGEYDNSYVGAFYQTGHNDATNDIIDARYQGCIALNVLGSAFNNDDDSTGTGTTLENCITYDSQYAGYANGNTARPITIDNFTSGLITAGHIVSAYSSSGTIQVNNSILWDASGDALRSGNSVVTGYYCDTYDTANNGSGTGVIHINPLTNGLLYLLRIEALSTLLTAGESGGQMGAEVLKKYGTDGALYGDTGYNTLSTDDIWPWPYEDRIKTDLSLVSTRGFCAAGTRIDGVNPITLTSYIWEYLGNEIPSDIYGGSPTYDAPIVTILTESQSTTAETITIIGSLTTDSELTGSGVDVNGVAATADDGVWDETLEAWTAVGVSLSLGTNTITATGTDSDSATGTDTVSITRTVPAKISKINGAAVLKGAVIHQ